MNDQEQIAILLDEFQNAIGKPFTIAATIDSVKVKIGFSDTVINVDREFQTVIGEKGEYPAVWCHLKQQQPASLKKFRQLKQQQLFI